MKKYLIVALVAFVTSGALWFTVTKDSNTQRAVSHSGLVNKAPEAITSSSPLQTGNPLQNAGPQASTSPLQSALPISAIMPVDLSFMVASLPDNIPFETLDGRPIGTISIIPSVMPIFQNGAETITTLNTLQTSNFQSLVQSSIVYAPIVFSPQLSSSMSPN
jgi:hypothetical protein